MIAPIAPTDVAHFILLVKVHCLLLITTIQVSVSVGLLKLAKKLQALQCGHLGSITNPDTFFNGEALPENPLGSDSRMVLFSAWNKTLRQATPNPWVRDQSRQGIIKAARHNHWEDLASLLEAPVTSRS